MKKIILLVLALLTICTSALAADFSKLIIMHTNDSHGYDQRQEGINGLATVKALKDDFLKKGYNVLLVDAGDFLQENILVNYSKGKSAVEFFNAVGYDFLTLGNHEFDYGQDVLQKRIKESKALVRSCNVFVDATGKLLVPASAIIQKGDVKIGLVGVTTPSVKTSSSPRNTKGLTILDDKKLYEALQKEINSLKAQGCDLIVVVSHMGSVKAAGYAIAEDVLANVQGIDILIDGHDHQVKNSYTSSGTLFVEAGCHTENIGVIKFAEGKWVSDLYKFGRFNQEDAKVKAIVDKEANKINKDLGKKIGETDFALSGDRAPGLRTQEMPLGNFGADAFLWQARQAAVLNGKQIDAAIVNGGDYRTGIKQGAISKAKILDVFPFENYLVVETIPGSALLEILEAASSAAPQAIGAFPQVAGIEFELDLREPYVNGEKYFMGKFYKPKFPGKRVKIKTVNGKPFDPKANYNICVTTFLSTGGDAYALLAEYAEKSAWDIGYQELDALTNYLITELKGKISDKYRSNEGRITIIK